MRAFVLFLVLLISSFSLTAEIIGCMNCFDFASGVEKMRGGGDDYDAWIEAYDFCLDELNPCEDDLEEMDLIHESN